MQTMFGTMTIHEITAGSVIDALGGTGEVASALELHPSTVSCWRERGLPSASGRLLQLAKLASEKGVRGLTLEALAELAETRA